MRTGSPTPVALLDIDTQSFIDYYEKNHVPLVSSIAATPTVYKRTT
jgi:hypothetical protein